MEFFSLLLRRRKRFVVKGNSMNPVLACGDEVLVNAHAQIVPGQVVVAQHPFKPTIMVKRVCGVNESGQYDLRGDNPAESTDSRSLGLVSADKIVGVVTSRIKVANKDTLNGVPC